MNKIKSLLIGLSILISTSAFSNYNNYYDGYGPDMGKWTYAVNGTSSLWELHLIKNDGMDSHVKFRCAKLHECWLAFDRARYRSNEFDFAKSVWMERLSSKIYLVH